MAKDLRAEVLAYCLREGLTEPGQTVVCALSGGADSMALLWCLYGLRQQLSITLTAAHFNHRLRGAESDADEAFVRSFCARHGIELTVGSADVAAHAKAAGKTVEEAARELRYAFLESLPAHRIATAHHAADNAETVLMHLLRGTGLRGLTGIAPKRGRIIRPLLFAHPETLRQWLGEAGIPWVEDSTNAADFCTRNRLRHRILPALTEEAPWFLNNLEEQTAILRAEDAWLDEAAAAFLDGGTLDCSALCKAPPALQPRILRLWLGETTDLSRAHIQALLSLAQSADPSAQVSLPKGLTARRVYDRMVLQEAQTETFDAVPLNLEGETKLPTLGLKIICTPLKNSEKIPNSPFQFVIGYDKIHGSVVRPRKRGDTICLPGGHHTTLKKLFIDRKIPRHTRERIPVLSCGDTVLGVVGIGRNEDVRPEAGAPALRITIEKEEKPYASEH